MTLVEEICELFEKGGAGTYFGERVTQLQHAVQAAHCAVEARADDELGVAALLHDIGHLLGGDFHAEIGVIDIRATKSSVWLSRCERCSGQESCDRSPRHSVPCRFSGQVWVPPAKAAARKFTQDDATRTMVAHLTDPGATGGTIS